MIQISEWVLVTLISCPTVIIVALIYFFRDQKQAAVNERQNSDRICKSMFDEGSKATREIMDKIMAEYELLPYAPPEETEDAEGQSGES